MVFYCRCFSFLLQHEDEETEYEARTQAKSTTTTYYTAASDFNLPKLLSKTIEAPSLAEKSNNLRVFTVAELREATNDFCSASKIGEGGFGTVYKGVIKSLDHPLHQIQVAVKRANKLLQGQKWRVREVNVLGTVEHPNLVKLIGYCAEDSEKEDGTQLFLVYEYMVNGSLMDHLSAQSETPLSWNARLKVAQDAARVLTYLHEEMEFQIVFTTFKSSNVLFDDQWNAKLSDLGVAQLLDPDVKEVTHISTKLEGSVEYAPPEYFHIGLFTSKGDVWCYGIFLYGLITGRHPLELIMGDHGSDWKRPLNEKMLLEWVTPYLGSKRFHQIIDPGLEGKYPFESAKKLCIIANKCLSENPKSRPNMSEVLQMVNQLVGVPSQATTLISPQLPKDAIDPNKVFLDPTQDEKSQKTGKDTKHEGRKGSMKIQVKKSVCLPQISPSKLLKSCSMCGRSTQTRSQRAPCSPTTRGSQCGSPKLNEEATISSLTSSSSTKGPASSLPRPPPRHHHLANTLPPP